MSESVWFVSGRERIRDDKKRDRNEDEEDVYERRRLERRLRDKEAAYQEVRAPFPRCATTQSAESCPFVMSRVGGTDNCTTWGL